MTWPAEHEQAWRNRRIIAERLGWPVGAVQECEWIERDHPEWSPVWMESCAWNKRPAGYFAQRYDRDRHDVPAYGATPAELAHAIETAPPSWIERHMTYRPLAD